MHQCIAIYVFNVCPVGLDFYVHFSNFRSTFPPIPIRIRILVFILSSIHLENALFRISSTFIKLPKNDMTLYCFTIDNIFHKLFISEHFLWTTMNVQNATFIASSSFNLFQFLLHIYFLYLTFTHFSFHFFNFL